MYIILFINNIIINTTSFMQLVVLEDTRHVKNVPQSQKPGLLYPGPKEWGVLASETRSES